MKKALALLLALVMVFALCACGNSTAPAADPTEAPAEATPEATEAHVVSEETTSPKPASPTPRPSCGLPTQAPLRPRHRTSAPTP